MALLGSLYLWELSALLLLLSLYRLATKPTLASFLVSSAGHYFLIGLFLLVMSSLLIIHQFFITRHSNRRQAVLVTMMNLISVVTIISFAELTVRFFSVQTPSGIAVWGTLLLPRQWQDVVAQCKEAKRKPESARPYFELDKVLGVTVGSNRSTEDGLYFSSLEGIRSHRTGISYADSRGTYRIALVGDSFTFGEGVSYEQTWGHQLELRLGPGFQVLNFGVLGYGLDQMYLRYDREIRQWHPDIVIMAFIPHDLIRTLHVYSFFNVRLFSEMSCPTAKPRFVIREGQLSLINVPLPSPEEIISISSISDLPAIDYDMNFSWTDWERPYWRYVHLSYLFRLIVSLHPPIRIPNEYVSEKAMEALATELLRTFVLNVRASGSIPLVVYFPVGTSSFSYTSNDVPGEIKIMQESKIEYTTPAPCLEALPASDHYIAPNLLGSGHFTPQANAAVARCLHEEVVKLIKSLKHPRTDL